MCLGYLRSIIPLNVAGCQVSCVIRSQGGPQKQIPSPSDNGLVTLVDSEKDGMLLSVAPFLVRLFSPIAQCRPTWLVTPETRIPVTLAVQYPENCAGAQQAADRRQRNRQ